MRYDPDTNRDEFTQYDFDLAFTDFAKSGWRLDTIHYWNPSYGYAVTQDQEGVYHVELYRIYKGVIAAAHTEYGFPTGNAIAQAKQYIG